MEASLFYTPRYLQVLQAHEDDVGEGNLIRKLYSSWQQVRLCLECWHGFKHYFNFAELLSYDP